jgi:hypothetical protein
MGAFIVASPPVRRPNVSPWGMATDGSRARDLRAVYAFRGLPEELNRTLPLDAGEHVIIEGTLLRYKWYLSQRISYVRLTTNRFLLLRHYAFRPDTVTEVPPGAIRKVNRAGARLEITWTGHDGRISMIALTPWAMPKAWSPAFTNLDQLTSDLRAWLGSIGWTEPRDK